MRVGLTVLALCLLAACGPDTSIGDGATPEQASVVVMRTAVESTTDPLTGETSDQLVSHPVCMGVAVGPRAILTATHCVEVSPVYFVDAWTWAHTASGKAVAHSGAVAGEVLKLVPDADLTAWVSVAAKANGAATIVRLRGTDLVSEQTELTGFRVSIALEHGDSGSGLFEGGRVVGLVQACDDANNDELCEQTGGRFAAVVP